MWPVANTSPADCLQLAWTCLTDAQTMVFSLDLAASYSELKKNPFFFLRRNFLAWQTQFSLLNLAVSQTQRMYLILPSYWQNILHWFITVILKLYLAFTTGCSYIQTWDLSNTHTFSYMSTNINIWYLSSFLVNFILGSLCSQQIWFCKWENQSRLQKQRFTNHVHCFPSYYTLDVLSTLLFWFRYI